MTHDFWSCLVLCALTLGQACSKGPSAGTVNNGTAGGSTSGTSPLATAGGTITFENIGATGWWGRRLNIDPNTDPNDPNCNVESDTINLGAAGGNVYCCRTKHTTTSTNLSPFDEQMTLIMQGPLVIKQFAVYQPDSDANAWTRVSFWDTAGGAPTNIKFTGPNNSNAWTGRLGDGCQWYATQTQPFPCGPGSDPYCPASGPDIDYNGWSASKLLIFNASMPAWDDASISAQRCSSGTPPDAPWIGFSASELMRDGWGKYFPCHCYDNTNGSVGAGCGEINVFECVGENQGTQYGNNDILSTGLRSFQVGSLGGNVCGSASCNVDAFPATADLLDACSKKAIVGGAQITYGSNNGACPVWRRPRDARYFFALLDTANRTIQVGILSPANLPPEVADLLPALPQLVTQATIDAVRGLRLPVQLN